MPPTVLHDRRTAHHPVVAQVERDRLAANVRTALLALRAHVNGRRDTKSKQLHKDIQQGKNKAPETIATLLTEAFNDRAPLSDVIAVCDTIIGFFTAKRRGHIRKLRELSPLETRVEGELNCVQVSIDQGDHSAPTLHHFIEELDVNIALLKEMRQSAVEELFGPEEARS